MKIVEFVNISKYLAFSDAQYIFFLWRATQRMVCWALFVLCFRNLQANSYECPLYHLMVEDSNGMGRTVIQAFLQQETTEMISKMLNIFVDMMGEEAWDLVKLTMMDKHNTAHDPGA